jgi:starch synthase
MQTTEFGWGLEGVARERAADLYGILNGVDDLEWNPETDPLIAANFSAADISGKALCKKDLQRSCGLPELPGVPLIGMVSRLVRQKGIDVLASVIPRILDLDLQFVLLGAGEPWAHFYFGDIMAAYPHKFSVHIGYNNTLAHRIEAGSDFFLMPSAFEPCGLNQMYSMRYGTLPIVRATGGLDDSVENFDEANLTGTGFKFKDLTPSALFDTIGWAVHTWYNRGDAMGRLVKNAMGKRFTWEEAASKYEKLYYLAVKKRMGEGRFRQRFHEPAGKGLLQQEGATMESRITDVEIHLMHQEHTVEELNKVVVQQQREIDRLGDEIELIKRQLRAIAPSDVKLPSEEEPPPHY